MSKLVHIVEFSSPVYISRYYSDSGEDAENFDENADTYRWRGECENASKDDIYQWLDSNVALDLSDSTFKRIKGHYLFMGEKGVLCDIRLSKKQLKIRRIPRGSDSVWRNQLTIRYQPSSKEIPRELLIALKKRDYSLGNKKIDESLMTLPELNNI